MSEALAVVNPETNLVPMKIEDLIRQVQLVQHTMKAVMQEGTHYGKVPGCGDKPSLFKAGAEKLAFVFRLAPHLTVVHRDLANGHREYEVTCTLKTIGGDVVVAQGVGSCSTMEGKYRFRTGPKKFTGKPVPSIYWTARETDAVGAKRLLGGDGFSVSKNPDNGNQWEIVEQGGKVEHDNPADYFNTVLKMAKKRAQVDATLTGTAASDCFDQDMEDLTENLKAAEDQVTLPASGSKPLNTVPHGTSQAAGGETAENGQKTASQPKASPGKAEGWRAFPIPFGKAKGALLGDIPTSNLIWWIETYVPKPFGNATAPSKGDIAFRAALDAARDEMKQRKEEQDAGGPVDQTDDGRPKPPPQENIDEDVPF